MQTFAKRDQALQSDTYKVNENSLAVKSEEEELFYEGLYYMCNDFKTKIEDDNEI